MASISFPTTTSNISDRTQIDSNTKAAAVQAEQTTTTSTKDTVEISTAAQAKLLHQQGQSVSSIASALGTDTKTVDGYLGINTQDMTSLLQTAGGTGGGGSTSTAKATTTTASTATTTTADTAAAATTTATITAKA
jgi:hypothetical protein